MASTFTISTFFSIIVVIFVVCAQYHRCGQKLTVGMSDQLKRDRRRNRLE
jgi:hypothetical protein